MFDLNYEFRWSYVIRLPQNMNTLFELSQPLSF